MAKTKNNRFLKVAGLMLGVTMLATCVLSGTMAKYTSTGTANSVTANAGKWSITVDGEELEATMNLSIDDMEIVADEAAAGGSTYAGTDPVPGTYGYKAIEIKNESVVDAEVSVSATGATNADTSISVGFLTTQPTGDAITSEDLSSTPLKINAGKSKTIYIAYNWEFEGQDEPDTTLGKTEGAINFGSITVTATQAKVTQ